MSDEDGVLVNPESTEEVLLYLVEAAGRDLSETAGGYARKEPIKSILWAAAAGAIAMALVQLAARPRARDPQHAIAERRRA